MCLCGGPHPCHYMHLPFQFTPFFTTLITISTPHVPNITTTGSKPEAFKEIKFTVGREETDFCQLQNDHLKSKGLPYYIRMNRSIGNSVYIWTQSTKDASQFITHFELAHPDPTHALYKTTQMRKQHYELIECSGTKMQIWVKRDRRRDFGIKSIALSFTEAEETRFIVDKYSKVDITLAEFDLPDTFLWIEKVDKVKTVEVDNTNKLIAEIKKGMYCVVV